MALSLKQLPKKIGTYPETGELMVVGIGRFGPYVKCGDVFASIPKNEDMFTISIDRAVELVEAKKQKSAGKPKRVTATKPKKAAAKPKATTKKKKAE